MNISSFQLIRTNPLLTTNIKLVVSEDYKLYLESFNANKQLSDDKYKHFYINSNEKYEDKLPLFYADLDKENAFTSTGIQDSGVLYKDYKNQYDTTYWAGAKQIEDQWHEEEFEYFAPLYIEKDNIPDSFIILRVDDALISDDNDNVLSLTKDNFRSEILDKWKCVNMFDLTSNTELGKYLDLNYSNNENFPSYSFVLDNRQYSFSKWFGIDFNYGKYTEKNLFLTDILNYEQPHFKLEKFITNGFKTNGLVYPKILNLKYLFNDQPSTPYQENKYSINRYYGFYAESLSLIKNITSSDFPNIKKSVTLTDNIFSEYPFIESWDTVKHYIYANNNAYKVKQIIGLSDTYYKIIADTYININDITNKNIVNIDFTENEDGTYENKLIGRFDNFVLEKYINEFGEITGLPGDLYLIKIDNKFHVLKNREVDIESSIFDSVYPDAFSNYYENDGFVFNHSVYDTSLMDTVVIKDKINTSRKDITLHFNKSTNGLYVADDRVFILSDNKLFRKRLTSKGQVESELSYIRIKWDYVGVDKNYVDITNMTGHGNDYIFTGISSYKNGSVFVKSEVIFKISKEIINEKIDNVLSNKESVEEITITTDNTNSTDIFVETYNVFVETSTSGYDDIDYLGISTKKIVSTINNIYLLTNNNKLCSYIDGEFVLEVNMNGVLTPEPTKIKSVSVDKYLHIGDIDTKENVLFIGTGDGMLIYDENTDSFTEINKENKSYQNSDNIVKISHDNNYVYMMAQDKESIKKYFLYILKLEDYTTNTSLYITFDHDKISWYENTGSFIIHNNKLYSTLFENQIDIITSNNYVNYNYYINTDYAINSDPTKLEYWTNDKNNYKSIDLSSTEPMLYPIYKVKFTDIKDFDFDRVDTNFSKFENDMPASGYKKTEVNSTTKVTCIKTDEHKLHTIEHRDKSIDQAFKYYSVDSVNPNKLINVSSEYISSDELYEHNNISKPTDIWSKEPTVCKWGFDGSNDSNDSAYKLNNSLKVGSYFNRSVDLFNRDPNIMSKNLDYFYRIGEIVKDNSKVSYLNQSLNIETNEMSKDSKKFNISNYVDANFDYFSYFFNNKMEILNTNNEIKVVNTDKFSVFKGGDSFNSSKTLFKGLNLELYGVSDMSLEIRDDMTGTTGISSEDVTQTKIVKNIIKTDKKFNNYKFSIILNNIEKGTSNTVSTNGNRYYFYKFPRLNTKVNEYSDYVFDSLEMPVIYNPVEYDKTYLSSLIYNTLDDTSDLLKVKEFHIENYEKYFIKMKRSDKNSIDITIDEDGNILSNEIFKTGEIFEVKPAVDGDEILFYDEGYYDNDNVLLTELTDLTIINPAKESDNSNVVYISLNGIDRSILTNLTVSDIKVDIIDYLYEPIGNRSSLYFNDYVDENNSGINVFLNDKYKNVLIIINYISDDNEINNISVHDKLDIGQERNMIYHTHSDNKEEVFKNLRKLTANNFVNAINDINQKHGYDNNLVYHYISEKGKYAKSVINDFYNNSTMKNISGWGKPHPPFILNINLPERIRTRKKSFRVTPLLGPYNIDYVSRKLDINKTNNDFNYIYRYNGGFEPMFKNIEIFNNLEYITERDYVYENYSNHIEEYPQHAAAFVNEQGESNETQRRLNDNQLYLTTKDFITFGETNQISLKYSNDFPGYTNITGFEISINTNLTDTLDFGRTDSELNSAIISAISHVDGINSDPTTLENTRELLKSLTTGEYIDTNISALLFNGNIFQVDVEEFAKFKFENGISGSYKYGDSVNNSFMTNLKTKANQAIGIADTRDVSFIFNMIKNSEYTEQYIKRINSTISSSLYYKVIDRMMLNDMVGYELRITSVMMKYYYNIPFISGFEKSNMFLENNTAFSVGNIGFAKVKELVYSKVNENTNFFYNKPYNAIYPMLDHFGYSVKDHFIFKSTWDSEFYTKTNNKIKKLDV